MIEIALVLLAFLGGRWTAPEQTVTVPIKVPVPVECRVAVPARPAMPTEGFESRPGVDVFVQGALAEIEIREGYEGQLRAALEACTAPIQ
ncbi:MAG: hypothetical protein ACOY95_03090 [Pseudomonadota bacterium]